MARRLPDPPDDYDKTQIRDIFRVYHRDIIDIQGAINTEINLVSYSMTSAGITSPYNAGDRSIILVDASSGAFSVILPDPSGYYRRLFVVKKTDTSGNAVTITASASAIIETSASYVLSTGAVQLVSDGTKYHKIN